MNILFIVLFCFDKRGERDTITWTRRSLHGDTCESRGSESRTGVGTKATKSQYGRTDEDDENSNRTRYYRVRLSRVRFYYKAKIVDRLKTAENKNETCSRTARNPSDNVIEIGLIFSVTAKSVRIFYTRFSPDGPSGFVKRKLQSNELRTIISCGTTNSFNSNQHILYTYYSNILVYTCIINLNQ